MSERGSMFFIARRVYKYRGPRMASGLPPFGPLAPEKPRQAKAAFSPRIKRHAHRDPLKTLGVFVFMLFVDFPGRAEFLPKFPANSPLGLQGKASGL